MSGHPFDVSDPSSADGPADVTRAPVTADQGYLRRDRPPPRTADDIAALTIDRDDARAALYRAHAAMGKVREDRDALRAEVGVTFKKLCDAATLAGVRERERDEARAELAASQSREATYFATLGEIVNLMGYSCEPSCEIPSCKAYRLAEAILVDPSPVADALGRVARASVRAVQAEWEPDRATLDQARIAQRAAVDNLLAVAPHWGEPQGGG